MKRKVVISNLECMKCGQIFPIPRETSRRRKGGHIKDLYCINCKKTTKHIEQNPNKFN